MASICFNTIGKIRRALYYIMRALNKTQTVPYEDSLKSIWSETRWAVSR